MRKRSSRDTCEAFRRIRALAARLHDMEAAMLYVFWLSIPLAMYEMWLKSTAELAPKRIAQPKKIPNPR